MNRIHYLLLAAVLFFTACDNRRAQQQQELRRQVRQQFLDEKLDAARAQLARTDSLLQLAEASCDSADVQHRLRLDSLKTAADVQGAKVRYLLRKQRSAE